VTSVEKPIFLIAFRDEWVCGDLPGGVPVALAFGTFDEAQKYVRQLAEDDGHPAALYRIVEYTFSGRVSEGSPEAQI
jgi:hypothetical protein